MYLHLYPLYVYAIGRPNLHGHLNLLFRVGLLPKEPPQVKDILLVGTLRGVTPHIGEFMSPCPTLRPHPLPAPDIHKPGDFYINLGLH